ncbi:copper amine oxidase N-terminal domain-containing protein [Brevibacillus sp. TJ4]|uniref:copper amine oxidase N-terminal domain-containing protein n=1 Tax=Brevibacillus sp. TJ4 TaxID=3234853 RepID=UPI0037D5CE01
MLRKVSALLLTAALLTGSVAATAALGVTTGVRQEANVKLNGRAFEGEIVIENGVVYVNASKLATALGGSAAWDNMIESVLIAKDGTYALRMYKDSTFAYKNGEETRVPHPLRTIPGAVLVPLGFTAAELGATVTYDEASQTYQVEFPIQK